MAPTVLLVARAGETVLLALFGMLWVVWALSAAYLLVLTAGAALHPILARGQKRQAGRRASTTPLPAAPQSTDPRDSQDSRDSRKIGILIPAHNEELLLGGVLDRLRTLDYPPDSSQIFVIADNCTDSTAQVARAHGGEVLERTDAGLRGKGYALEWALRLLLQDEHRFDAFLILDADSYLSENFLQVMDDRLKEGHSVIQGLYEVENAGESWRTKLMACALALAHYVKPLGRMAFGLSDGLKGNGMCFSREVLAKVPWSGESITEDIEYTLRLVQAGIRITFAPEAVVRAQMPATSKQAASQRRRWEGGRYALLSRSISLLAQSLRCGRPLVADRAIELIIPPFAELFALPAVCLIGGGFWLYKAPYSFAACLWLAGWGAILAAGAVYLAAGLVIARVPLKVSSALLFAPVYIMWKLGVYGAMMVRRGAGGWVRTERH